MLRIGYIEAVRGMLMRIPGLVDLEKRGDSAFVQEVERWLTELEQLLYDNRISAAGSVATFRGELISAQRGVIPAEIVFHGKPTRRKIKEATAVHVLRQVNDLVLNVIHKDIERVAKAERMGRQLVAIAKAKGLIQELPSGENHTEKLKVMWRTLSSDPDISPGIINVEGLIGPQDTLIVLDRIITSDIP